MIWIMNKTDLTGFHMDLKAVTAQLTTTGDQPLSVAKRRSARWDEARMGRIMSYGVCDSSEYKSRNGYVALDKGSLEMHPVISETPGRLIIRGSRGG